MDEAPIKKELLLKRTISRLKRKRKKYLEKVILYRRLNGYIDTFVAVNTTVSTTCLILSFSFVGLPLLIVSVITSCLASVAVACKKSSKLDTKLDAHKTSYLSLTDLIRSLELDITRDNTPGELDVILEHCFDQMSLIQGTAIPLSISPEETP